MWTRSLPNTSYFIPKQLYLHQIRHKWLHLICREDLIEKAPTSYSVCEDHFNERDILPTKNRKVLKKNVIPSLNLPLLEADKETTSTTEDNTDTSRKRKSKTNISAPTKKFKLSDIENSAEEEQKTVFNLLCDKFLTKELTQMVQAQTNLKNYYKRNKHRDNYIYFCLNLYYTSPQAYFLLQKALCLPSSNALHRDYIPITTKIDDRVIFTFRSKVYKMSDREKNCSVIIGAYNLKPNIFRNTLENKVIGYHEVNGVQTVDPAKHAVVIVLRGIFVNWTQPIGYALLSDYNKYEEIVKWIDDLVTLLFDIGLNIRTLVSDIGSDLLNAALNHKTRSVSPEKPYFYINKRKIYYIIDATHLIKLVRNNLMVYDFHFEGGVAKYGHIVNFYKEDEKRSYRLAYKLTNKHINPTNSEKLNVCYAAQLLSKTVATGISTYVDFKAIDESGRDTVEFIIKMNDLFDSLNSFNLNDDCEYKRAFRGEQSQVDFLKDMLTFFQNLTLMNPKNGDDVTSSVQFIKGFQITVNSILMLFEDLKKEEYSYLLTRRLNQDVLDNFFGETKTKNCPTKVPTTREFISAFRKQFFANIVKPPKGANCADDMEKLLVQTNSLVDPGQDVIPADTLDPSCEEASVVLELEIKKEKDPENTPIAKDESLIVGV